MQEKNYREIYPYLNLLKKPLNDQQLSVCCHMDNCVVAAGAGSGKTQVLATRFAWLVMEHDDIEAPSILTLTFTRKAAAEMYQRIYDTLRFFADNEAVPLRQRNNAQKALKQFSGVHIQTLDSYCTGIVRQTANRYGIRPDFISGEEDSELSQTALSFVLKNRNRKGIQHFAEPGKLQEFAEKIFLKSITSYTSLASPENYFSAMLEVQKEKITAAWNAYADCEENGFCGSLRKLAESVIHEASVLAETEDIDKKLSKIKNAAEKIKKISTVELPENFCSKICSSEIETDRKNLLEKMNECISLAEGLSQFSTKSKNELIVLFMEAVEKLSSETEMLKSIYSFVLEYEYIKDLDLMLDDFSSEVNARKRKNGNLTFKDCFEMTLKILIEQKDIRSQEKSTFKKIMIDEFQDNNGKNRDLLFLLSEKNNVFTEVPSDYKNPDEVHDKLKSNLAKDKLFFVGDEKQSIYKFRGADVSVFNELKKDLEDINGKDSSLYMVYNYRSTPELITSFNQMFGGFEVKDGKYNATEKKSVFMKEFPESFEALFTEKAIARTMKDSEEQKPAELNETNVPVHAALLIKSKEAFDPAVKAYELLDAENQTAYFIAGKIKELHEKGVSYSDIAILDRNRKKRRTYTSWLERLEIPYSLDQQNGIFQDAPVNDIYSFLRLCVYPSDINAYASWLCSPFAGLTENQLERILACVLPEDKKENFRAFSEDKSVKNKIQKSLGKDSEAFRRFIAAENYFIEQQPLVLSRPVTETINKLWYERGYRFETLLTDEVNLFAEQYDLLFELSKSADSNGKSAAWFVDELAVLKSKEKSFFNSEDSEIDLSEINYPLERESAVQILTVHKSKGLQYKYVFLLGTFGGVSAEKIRDIYFNEETGVSFKTVSGKNNYFQELNKELSESKNLAELRRLIYVGATRAEKELYVVDVFDLPKSGHTYSDETVMDNLVKEYYPGFEQSECGKKYNEKSPFDLTVITPAPYSLLASSEKKENPDALRNRKIKELEEKLQSSGIKFLDEEKTQRRRITPSAMEKNEVTEENKAEAEKLFPELDSIIDNAGENKISAADFGTLSHLYLEKNAQGFPLTSALEQGEKFLRKLKASDRETVNLVCSKFCTSFNETSEGRELLSCRKEKRFYRAEYQFKMNICSYIVTGSIDLVFENADGTYTIVDYKTDSEVQPEKYYNQQACYRKAFSMLKHVSEDRIKCSLYFLRYNLMIDITENTDIEMTEEKFRTYINA